MKPASRVEIRARRLNGALSRGPITGEGKRRSSPNGAIHSLYSRQVLLRNESREDFGTPGSAIVQQYIGAFHPRNTFALELVREMAVAHWRHQPIWSIEKRMMTEKMPQMSPIWDEIVPESAIFDEDDEPTREPTQTTQAFWTLAQNNRHFVLLSHHEYQQKTIFLKTLHRLLAARGGSPEPEKSEFSIPNPPDDFFMDSAK